MRITNNMLSQNLLRNLEAAQGRMDDLQNQMSSGHRITKPSDDPVGIENALRLKSSISMVEQWKNNADEALAYMDSTDTILGDMTSMLQRVRELAIQGANDSLSAEDKKKVAMEVDQLTEQLRAMANSKIGSKYVFAGTKTDTPPLDPLSEPIPSPPPAPTAWAGNDKNVTFEVGNNLKLPISVKGTELFQVTISGTTASVGMFQSLYDLSTALRADKAQDVANTVADIQAHIDNVLSLRADLGARVNRMTAIREQLDSTSVNLKQNLSDIQDADMAKTIVDFKNQENVFRAALSVGAQIIQPSLVDFMK
ncbi:MAG: flagellar hook-associated protein FlgL [Desulfitobacteriaceae bacterium]|nr:flagellar hook-associated protein FlgL [Desulfitobacteriaceae bacterium]MDI6879467.1 flagellar hook-associated protein FlgL [Desulfitobacteriaceae bacterium]MDI6912940.1 flagellar hook-associated protein FlgL [Desulfitobacteriaceae bacterium]